MSTHTDSSRTSRVRRIPATCHNCGMGETETFFTVEGIPVHSCLLMDSREQAVSYPKGNLRLAFCPSCGFIQNAAFDPCVHEYSTRYEETQGFSARFNDFARDLAERLIERHDLRGKKILEIGCGKGEFLVLMCELGRNRGIGIDPGYVEDRTNTAAAVDFIRDFYSEKYSDLAADFVCCRHTLEHIQPTHQFLSMIRRSIGDRLETIVFFELPDVGRILDEGAFWDLYYEHCSYFSPGSLGRLFRSCGFEVIGLEKGFGDQYLLIEARPIANGPMGEPLPVENDLQELSRGVDRFMAEVHDKIEQWKDELRARKARGERVVLWGSGSKAVAFLTTTAVSDELRYVVDINPYRQGKFMPGTGHEIVAPAFLREYRPDVVIVMNPIYRNEIREDLEAMGLCPEILTV